MPSSFWFFQDPHSDLHDGLTVSTVSSSTQVVIELLGSLPFLFWSGGGLADRDIGMLIVAEENWLRFFRNSPVNCSKMAWPGEAGWDVRYDIPFFQTGTGAVLPLAGLAHPRARIWRHTQYRPGWEIQELSEPCRLES